MRVLILLLVVVGGVYLTTQSSLWQSEYSEKNTPVSLTGSDISDILDEARNVTGVAKKIEIYDGITVAVNDSVVDISGRELSGSLRAEIRMLQNVLTLDISHNNFTDLPAEIGQLQTLQILDLSHNPLSGLPLELGNLQNLQKLDLRNTSYSESDLEKIKMQLPASVVILVD